ncbi:hypothetical protein KY348_07020 [Candidatus Woesearchaeota archaeon]|nr:hypothetical protein [Candidatus Woesearchaeota archaeon]
MKYLRDDGKAWHADGGWYSRRFTKEDLTELFAKAGLKCKIIKICPVNYIAFATKQ